MFRAEAVKEAIVQRQLNAVNVVNPSRLTVDSGAKEIQSALDRLLHIKREMQQTKVKHTRITTVDEEMALFAGDHF